jgi:hypothetical protein
MNAPATPRRNPLPGLLIALVVLGLVAYYFWPRGDAPAAPAPQGATPAVSAADPALASPSYGPLPPGAVSNVGGIPLDADGKRILNEAGLPLSNEPLPQAKPIPVKAPAGAIIGYTKDAAGNSQPLRAGDLKQIPNSPGTFAVVDMWADGGPTVVPPTEGKRLTPAESARLQAEEDARDRAASQRP